MPEDDVAGMQGAGAGPGAATRLARFRADFVGRIAYPGTPEDARVVRVMGVELPLRATTALFVATILELFDYSRTAIPKPVLDLNLAAGALRYQALERVILFGLVPLLVILFAFRDRPARYGLRLGDWRWGLAMSIVGCVLMTPIVLLLANEPTFAAYYAGSTAAPADVALTAAIDLAPSEFIFRGFLMFTLIRAMGPVGLVVAQLPFVFSHLSKPEVELFSTLFGGLIYGWVNWRTGSVVWSILPHIYIVTLAVLASAALHPGLMDDGFDLAGAWLEAQARLPAGWRLDSLQCASTGIAEAERSDDWVAVALGPGGEERRARAADPVAALAQLAVELGRA